MSHASLALAHLQNFSSFATVKPLSRINREELEALPGRILYAETRMVEASAQGAQRLLHEREHTFDQLVQRQAQLKASLKLRIVK